MVPNNLDQTECRKSCLIFRADCDFAQLMLAGLELTPKALLFSRPIVSLTDAGVPMADIWARQARSLRQLA